jgi:hypothetical protein
MVEKVYFPKNISRPILKEKELNRMRARASIEKDIQIQTELNKIEYQINSIKLFYFDPDISIETPKRLLEMAGLFAEHEKAKSALEEKLKGTEYEKSFSKTDGWHLADDLKDILAIRREASKFIKYRAILEDKNLDIDQKRKKLKTFANAHNMGMKDFNFPDNAEIDFFDSIENTLIGYNTLK